MTKRIGIIKHYFCAKYRRKPSNRAALEKWQIRRFQEFATRVLVHSPFYAPYVGLPLADYPMVDKAAMVANFDAMNTKGLRRDTILDLATRAENSRDFSDMLGGISIGLSSGTSGNRGLFAVSPEERDLYVGVALAKCLPGSLLRRRRVALLLRANNTLYEAAGDGGRISFRYFDLVRPIDELCRGLDAFRPDVVIGPPQALRLLAEAKVTQRLWIDPRKIISSAEVLDDVDRAQIAAAFECRVDQIYQATEGFLGATCSHGTLHLNEDYIHVERHWIDRASGRFMPIVTDFTRSTQPIIRYRLDDILVERAAPCPCGSPLTDIARIEGRFDDILALPSLEHDGLVPVLPDFIRDAFAHCHDSFSDYRVVQRDARHVDLFLQAGDPPAAFEVARQKLAAICTRAGAAMPSLNLTGPIKRDPLRKVRRVERMFRVSLEDLWPAS
jgi:putative adenylate-forming enzyme